MDYKKTIRNLEKLLREIGDYQVKNQKRIKEDFELKSTGIDLVTEVDKNSEAKIKNWIMENFEGHNFLGEEDGFLDNGSEYTWVVDPLDGTTNYAQGLHIFGISVGLRRNDDEILGVIYMPRLNEFYHAIKGEGAFLNGKKLEVSKKTELGKSVLATGFPYDRATAKNNNSVNFTEIMPKVRGIRRMGVASYDLALVAAGILDGYWEINLKPWDVSAGILMIKEAGGTVRYLDERGVSIVAGNVKIVANIISIVK